MKGNEEKGWNRMESKGREEEERANEEGDEEKVVRTWRTE